MSGFRSERQSSRRDTLAKDLDSLEESFSPSLIEKYREELMSWGVKYPGKDARWLLYKVAEPDEIEEAKITKKAGTGNGKPQAKRPVGSVTPAATEELDDRFKQGSGKVKTWNLGQTFRHLANKKSS